MGLPHEVDATAMCKVALLPDLDAPILPGVGAAGFRVGMRMGELSAEVQTRFSVERRVDPCLPNAVVTLYHAESVTLYVENRMIRQVAVHSGYRGRLRGVIGPDSTIAEVETQVGTVVVEDDEVHFSIAGVEGLCLQVKTARDHHPPSAADSIQRPLSIAQIFVYGL